MKAKTIFGLILILALTVSANYAREFTFTTSATNITSAMARITDPPSLAGNLQAIIVATRIGTTTSIQHPIGAWYSNGKWHIFNSDNTNISAGLTYKLEVYLTPGANQFLHIITTSNLASGSSFIDHPLLNNQPNAQFKFLQNYAPDYRPGVLNPNEAAAFYDSTIGKWYIRNINGSPLHATTAYNIVIAPSAIGLNPNTDTPVGEATPKNPTPVLPASTAPTGNAGGDLNGTYPNPKVIGLQGSRVSNNAPTVGQILRYNVKEWEPLTLNTVPMWNASHLAGNKIDLNPTPPTVGQVLKWGGGGWYPANDETGIAPSIYNAGAGLSLNGATFSAQNTAAMWNANQIAGGKISTTVPPTAGQVLKWNGTEWAPAKDEVAAAAKPSVKYFTQIGNVNMYDPNGTSKPIVGLDNQTFELKESSSVVFHTTIEANIFEDSQNPLNAFGISQSPPTGVLLIVEILNSANTIVARSTSSARLTKDTPLTINSSGIGVLPLGNYHTKVTIKKQAGGAPLDVYGGDSWNQGGHLIIKIFPN